MEVKVTVVIPFYNVESFIARCTRSLMEQTLQDVEFIFVNDASPDRSEDIIREVVSGYDRDVTIVSHEVNRGLPSARNTGMSLASGKYVYHCDSDDYLEPQMLERLFEAADRDDADIAYCDFYLDFGEKRTYMNNPDYKDADEMLKDGFLGGKMKYNVWNKLIRRSLFTDSGITFPDGHSMGEDMTIIMLSLGAGKVVHVQESLYHYMKINGSAYTNTFSERHLTDIRFNAERTIKSLRSSDLKDKELFINLFKLNIKLPFLFSGERKQYGLWKKWYPEADRFIMKNRSLPFRTKAVQYAAHLNLFIFVRIYTGAVALCYRLTSR